MKPVQICREGAIVRLEKMLYEKLAELEKQMENMSEEKSTEFLKKIMKCKKNSVERMEENENINLIRLGEAEKNWLLLKKSKEEVTVDKKSIEKKLNAGQFYKEKFEKAQKEMEKISKEYSKLETEISNLKKSNEQLQNKISKINEGGTDVILEDENEMKKAIAQLERKNVELMNENNELITKNYEIISEHEKCTDILAASQNQLQGVKSGESSLRLEYEYLKKENERLHLLRERIEKALELYYKDNKSDCEITDENNMQDKEKKNPINM